MVTLAVEEPFASVVYEDSLSNTCSFCFAVSAAQPGKTFSRCTKCRVVHYCDRKCQKKDWANHKIECSWLLKVSPIPDGMWRLVARVASKLGRSDAQDPSFNGRVYEDLMDHREEIEKDDVKMKCAIELSGLLLYAEKQRTPTRDELMSKLYMMISVVGKVYTNACDISYEINPIGIGLYLGISAQNHSCKPDLYVHFNGSKAILRSPDKNMKYSKDLTVSYASLLESHCERQKKLSSYYFTCTCPVCLDPTEDFVRNSVRSTCCPDSYCLLDPNVSELSCFNCGTPSEITVDEAVAANEEISSITAKMIEQFNKDRDQSAAFEVMTKTYEKFSKVLSPVNVNLLRITESEFLNARDLEKWNVCLEYAPSLRIGYKHYMALGDPSLTYRLTLLAAAHFHDPKPTRKGLEIYDEVFAAAVLSHGPTYPNLPAVKNMKMAYEAKLATGS